MKKYLFFILFSVSVFYRTNAQCGKELVELAKKEVATNEVVLKSYFVAFSESWNYDNVAKYALILNSGVKYRFIIKNSPQYKGRAIVRLRYICSMAEIDHIDTKLMQTKEQFVKDGFGFADYYKSFDYQTGVKNGVYQLNVRLTDGYEGCVAILVVYQKSK